MAATYVSYSAMTLAGSTRLSSHPELLCLQTASFPTDGKPKRIRKNGESLLPGEFRFSRSRIIIIFHGFIPLPLGDIVLLPRSGGSPGLMRLGDKLSSLAWRGRYQPATMELQLDCSAARSSREDVARSDVLSLSLALFHSANLRVTFIVVGCCRRQMVLRGVISGHLIAYQIASETPF